MMTVDGLFGAGDTLGGTPHSFHRALSQKAD